MRVADGHAPAAERLEQALADTLAALEDKIKRESYLISWFCEQYQHLLPQHAILRYEDLISSNGRTLQFVCLSARNVNASVTSKIRYVVYDAKLVGELGDRLLASDGGC